MNEFRILNLLLTKKISPNGEVLCRATGLSFKKCQCYERQRKAERNKGDQRDNTMTINVKSNLGLHPEAEKTKCLKGKYQDNWRNVNMDCILYTNILSMLNFLNFINALWLYKRISLFLGDIHGNILQ